MSKIKYSFLLIIIFVFSSAKAELSNYDKGKNLSEALPSTPVEILGINGAAKAGDDFIVFDNEKEVKT